MKIEIEIKPGTARRIAVVGVTLLIVGGAVSVYADQIQFSSGQTLTAADLNNNFNELYAKTAKPTRTLNGSVNGVRCGATSPTNGGFGTVLGHLAGNLACETQCASPTAHMCTAEEMVRTEQLGGVTPLEEGWISTGLSFAGVPAGQPVNDCGGWTVGTNIRNGTAFYLDGRVYSCDTQIPILCCD